MYTSSDSAEQRNSRTNLESSSTQRLEAFSDGVFAIAITLLILNVKVPSASDLANASLSSYLARQWPDYFAYIFSFLIIGIYWANHHSIFKLYQRTDHFFNLLNLLFLMTIAFLPYPTAVFGEWFKEPLHRQTATSFYAFAIFLPAISWLAMWFYAIHRGRLIDNRLTKGFIRYQTRLFVISNGLYFLSFLISLFSPLSSILLNVPLTLLYLLPPKKPEYI